MNLPSSVRSKITSMIPFNPFPFLNMFAKEE
jgi:hypothetical protein